MLAASDSRTKGGTLVVLSDTRDDTGHVLNQQADGRIFDPATPDTTYPDMRAWEAASNSDQHYQVQGVVTAREAEAIMALPPGSSERSALLAQTPLVDLKTGRATGQMATALSRISVADAASDTDVAAVLHANAAAAAAIDALPVGSGTEAIIGTAIEAAYQDLHNQNPNWTSAELMDRAVIAAHLTIVGADDMAQTGIDLVARDHPMSYVLRDALATGLVTAPTSRSDATNGTTLRPELNDLTNNQPHHIMSYLTMGYLAAGTLGGEATVDTAVYFHEITSRNGNVEDYWAGVFGRELGTALYSSRDTLPGSDISEYATGFLSKPVGSTGIQATAGTDGDAVFGRHRADLLPHAGG